MKGVAWRSLTGNCLPELAQTPDSERQEFCKVLDRPSDAAHMQKGRERDSMLMHLASTAVEVDSKAQQQIGCSSGGCSAERSELQLPDSLCSGRSRMPGHQTPYARTEGREGAVAGVTYQELRWNINNMQTHSARVHGGGTLLRWVFPTSRNTTKSYIRLRSIAVTCLVLK